MDAALSTRLATAQAGNEANPHVDRWLAKAQTAWAVGKNAQSEALHGLGLIAGILDDHSAPDSHWRGIPLARMNAIDAKHTVINCSTSVAPVNVNRALAQQGFTQTISLSSVLSHPECPIAQPWFVQQQQELLCAHAHKLDDLFRRMSDTQSKQTLLDVLRFRLTANAAYMQNYSVRLQEQYLEPFLQLRNEVFVDAGAYDGDTTEAFCSYCPTFEAAHLYEPSETNMDAAKRRLKDISNIHYHSLGLSNEPGRLSFDSEAGSASSVTGAGDNTIEVCRLDDDLKERPTFIKMDLEGWELHALQGCKGHIHNCQPKLAIAVYHQASHFLDVPELIDQYFDGYSIYMRHYTQGWSETVMFFIPPERQ